jgi:hypothetical protein
MGEISKSGEETKQKKYKDEEEKKETNPFFLSVPPFLVWHLHITYTWGNLHTGSWATKWVYILYIYIHHVWVYNACVFVVFVCRENHEIMKSSPLGIIFLVLISDETGVCQNLIYAVEMK